MCLKLGGGRPSKGDGVPTGNRHPMDNRFLSEISSGLTLRGYRGSLDTNNAPTTFMASVPLRAPETCCSRRRSLSGSRQAREPTGGRPSTASRKCRGPRASLPRSCTKHSGRCPHTSQHRRHRSSTLSTPCRSGGCREEHRSSRLATSASRRAGRPSAVSVAVFRARSRCQFDIGFTV